MVPKWNHRNTFSSSSTNLRKESYAMMNENNISYDDDDDDDDDDNNHVYDNNDDEDYQYLEDDEYNSLYTQFQKEQSIKTETLQNELSNRTGRLFEDPLHLSDEFLASTMIMDDLPDWTPHVVSHLAQSKMKVCTSMPKLEELKEIETVEPCLVSYSENSRVHLKQARQNIKKEIQIAIPPIVNELLVELDVFSIMDPVKQQDAIDILYERVEDLYFMEKEEEESYKKDGRKQQRYNSSKDTLDSMERRRKRVLKAHPQFSIWVERAIRNHLVDVKRHLMNPSLLSPMEDDSSSSDSSDSESSSDSDSDSSSDSDSEEEKKENDNINQKTTSDVVSETVDFLTSTTTTSNTNTQPVANPTNQNMTNVTSQLDLYLPNVPKPIQPTFLDLYPLPYNDNDSHNSNENSSSSPSPTLDKWDHLSTLFPITGIHGNLKEEWELQAHPTALRIMVRESTTDIAKWLVQVEKEQQQVGGGDKEDLLLANHLFVSGKAGVGKTAIVTSIVASARQSGYIVLYLPDGARLAEHGKYIVPSPRGLENDSNPKKANGEVNHTMLYDIPYLSKEMNQQLVKAHGDDIQQHFPNEIPMEKLREFFTEVQCKKQLGLLLQKEKNTNPDTEGKEIFKDSISLYDLLQKGSENESISAPVYSFAISILMTQTEIPFLAVLDEYNAYYQPKGHYFHGHYDPNASKSIPYDQINVFAPFLNSFESLESFSSATTTSTTTTTTSVHATSPPPSSSFPVGPKRGAVLACTTQSRPIPKKTTKNLISFMEKQPHVQVFHVLPYSKTEIEHVIANYECIGVGKLRFDEGQTLGNEEEMAFLRMHSGGIGMRLLDGIIF